MRIDQLKTEIELDCRYHPFPLHPETPDEGMSLEELFGGRLDVPAAMARLREVAESLGLAFGERSHTFNSRKAQELGLWAADQGRFADWEQATYRAYFDEGINIGATDELLKVVEGLGWNRSEAEMALANRTYAPRVDAEWDKAVSSGVRAVPTFRCEGREQIGFCSLEELLRLVKG